MGIPSAPIVTKAFKDLAILNAAKRGMPHERICFTQHPVWGKTPEELRVYVDGQDPVSQKPFMKEVVDALTVPLSDDDKKSGMVTVSVGPPTFTDTAENLQEFYLNNGYTDFLPIILPTQEKLDANAERHEPPSRRSDRQNGGGCVSAVELYRTARGCKRGDGWLQTGISPDITGDRIHGNRFTLQFDELLRILDDYQRPDSRQARV